MRRLGNEYYDFRALTPRFKNRPADVDAGENMRLVLAIFAALLIVAAGCTTPNPPAGQQGGAQGQQTGGSPTGGTPSGGTGGSSSGGNAVDLNACVTNCNVLADADLANTCKAGCYMGAAEDTKDASKCDPIATMQNMSIYYTTCLGSVAGEKQDISPCRKLTNSSDKDFCIVIAADKYKNPAICQEMTEGIYKSVCLDDTNQSAGK
jgi:hypothetical protein